MRRSITAKSPAIRYSTLAWSKLRRSPGSHRAVAGHKQGVMKDEGKDLEQCAGHQCLISSISD